MESGLKVNTIQTIHAQKIMDTSMIVIHLRSIEPLVKRNPTHLESLNSRQSLKTP